MKTKPKTMNKHSSSLTPLADLTNNLTPLSSLVNLCNSTNNLQNSPFSGEENRNPRNLRSSSFFNPIGVPPPTTPPLGEGGSGENSYNLRRSDAKYNEAIYGLTDSFLVENHSKRPIRMPSTCPVTFEKILDKNLGTVKNKDKETAIAVIPTRSAPLKTNNDKGKAIDVTPIRPARLNTVTRSKDKSVSPPFDKLKVKDIEIEKPSVASGSCHLIRDQEKQKGSSIPSRYSIIRNELKRKVKKTAAPSNEFRSETKNKDALQTPLNLCSKETYYKGKSLAIPSDSQPPFKPNEDLVKDMEIFTCPPLPTRSKRKRTSKDDVSKLPKSWTDPHPKKPKARRIEKEGDKLDFLPKEFVEKHRAYFKEVDEFELLEEEISDDDLDKE